MPTLQPPRDAPRRGRPPKIDRAQVVAAALDLGLDAFSMQGIADRLGVSTPALYSHVSGRDEVLALVGAELQSRLEAVASPAVDWRTWLTDFAHEVRRQLGPSASTLLARMSGPPAAVTVGTGERGLQLLLDAGFAPADAGRATWLVFRLALTAGPEQQARLTDHLGETAAFLAPVAPSTFPATQAVHAALVTSSTDEAFAFELRVLLDGLAHQLGPPSAEPTRERSHRP